ncbi:hypothetical protein BDB00DRAFT_842080 [Zychaea mexicana]|uniref:uncharacterized protein n=1 Tax=Zychaea mexicana TaxID=64656 RepID=UPI0022FEF6A2|nr:uncharacterized protein BDB00DRAFT_842080 [Zychaea mexicana]KAI9489697.1 hypothetical protein BDB00DRAFT_842080 [Zychaea mexicana]
MPPSNLDDALRDLEKQVIDFSLTVDTDNSPVPTTAAPAIHNNSNYNSRPDSSSNNPMHRHASLRKTPTSSCVPSDDDDDDNVCVAELRHRAQQQKQYPAHSRSNTLRGTRSRDASNNDNSLNLKRSVSTGGNSRFKITEPVPPLPSNLAVPPKDPSGDDDDQDLKAAMHCAWAVLEAGGEGADASNNKSVEATAQQAIASANMDKSVKSSGGGSFGTGGVSMKVITIRIYINDGSVHKTVQLTNMLTAAMVLQYLRKKGLVDKSEDWSLFEVAYSHDVERPLRDWEIVMDATSTWEQDTTNLLLVKKYKYRDSLMADSVLQKRYPPNYGWLSIELKKGRWQRRFFYIMDNAIHHAKDNKGTGSTPLCHLSAFDVYTMLHHVRGSPTEFVFAVRAQDKPHIFERPEDYMHLLAADDYDSLRQWVLSIRCAKNALNYQMYPHRVMNPLGPIDAPASTAPLTSSVESSRGTANGEETVLVNRSNTLRRHKSTKEFSRSSPSSAGNEEINKSGSGNGLSRHSSRRGRGGRDGADGPLINPYDRDPFSKGSLLANSIANSENEPLENSTARQIVALPSEDLSSSSQPQTLIQIDDRVKFSKGSLLEKSTHGATAVSSSGESKLSRSRSTRDSNHHHHHNTDGGAAAAATSVPSASAAIGGGETRRQMSVRRKPTTSRSRRHDVPMPASSAVPVPPNGPLLRPDEDPEQAHTRKLMERQIKPLINFNEPSTFDPRKR